MSDWAWGWRHRHDYQQVNGNCASYCIRGSTHSVSHNKETHFYLQWRHNEHDDVSNHHPHEFYSTFHSGAGQLNHQSSASLAFLWRINRWPVNSPHERPITRKNVSIWWRRHKLCFLCCYIIRSWRILHALVYLLLLLNLPRMHCKNSQKLSNVPQGPSVWNMLFLKHAMWFVKTWAKPLPDKKGQEPRFE